MTTTETTSCPTTTTLRLLMAGIHPDLAYGIGQAVPELYSTKNEFAEVIGIADRDHITRRVVAALDYRNIKNSVHGTGIYIVEPLKLSAIARALEIHFQSEYIRKHLTVLPAALMERGAWVIIIG